VLLVIAIVNAILREITYKPFLSPYIGIWAHQISSVLGIFFFYFAIYFFLKKQKGKYTKKDLLRVGMTWIVMTIIFECFMNFYYRELSVAEVFETYYFWKGETWIFVLISLLISPLVVDKKLKKT